MMLITQLVGNISMSNESTTLFDTIMICLFVLALFILIFHVSINNGNLIVGTLFVIISTLSFTDLFNKKLWRK